METIRGRLAVSYAILMIATLAVFAATIYQIERSWGREQVDLRLRIEADLIAARHGIVDDIRDLQQQRVAR